MYLYRAMSSNEVIERINNRNYDIATVKGSNTFKYNEDKKYVHFFKYASHAIRYKKIFALAAVAQIKLPDEIIPSLEYGFYSEVETYYDDSLKKYYIPLPEIILEQKLFNNDYIKEFYDKDSNFLHIDSYGNEVKEFTTQKYSLLEGKKVQRWTQTDIYYEYIKRLLPKFKYDVDKLANYLKMIDLDSQLEEFSNQIVKQKTITKRKY